MANRRVLVKRRKAVRNIRKITRTMELIATARFQTAFDRAIGGRAVHREARRAGRRPLARAPATSSTRCSTTATPTRRARAAGADQQPRPVRRLQRQRPARRASARSTAAARGEHGRRAAMSSARRASPTSASSGRPMAEQTSRLRGQAALRAGRADRQRADRALPRAARSPRSTSPTCSSYSAGRQRPDGRSSCCRSRRRRRPPRRGAPAAAQVEYEFSPEPRRAPRELLPATVRVRLFQASSTPRSASRSRAWWR